MKPPRSLEKPSRVLIVDDVPANLKLLRDALESAGYHILGASNGQAALRTAKGALPDIILLDVVMPGMDGYEVCRKLKADPATQPIPVIFVTMKDRNESLVEAFDAGGVDYITKPFNSEEVLMRVRTHLEISRLNRELMETNRELRAEIARREEAEEAQRQAEIARDQVADQLSLISAQEATRWGIEGFIGRSKTIEQILTEVHQLQEFGTASVLITGESGTGKELIARAIHFGGTRADGPFIAVNCSAIPADLAESAFFGHVRGAFSGAVTSRKGYFELANDGTLFLDEIGDMPLELQPKLLRVLEDGIVLPVGGVTEKQVDARVLAATNQDLQQRIRLNQFRQDLYFRLARVTVHVPPLREHRDDIPLLIEHFLHVLSVEMGIPRPKLTADARSALEAYHYPGNVRELRNLIEYALIRSQGAELRAAHFHFMAPFPEPQDPMAGPISDSGYLPDEFETLKELLIQRSIRQNEDEAGSTFEEQILNYVQQHGSVNNTECRELLEISFDQASYLLKKLNEYGLLVRRGERRWARYYLR